MKIRTFEACNFCSWNSCGDLIFTILNHNMDGNFNSSINRGSYMSGHFI